MYNSTREGCSNRRQPSGCHGGTGGFPDGCLAPRGRSGAGAGAGRRGSSPEQRADSGRPSLRTGGAGGAVLGAQRDSSSGWEGADGGRASGGVVPAPGLSPSLSPSSDAHLAHHQYHRRGHAHHSLSDGGRQQSHALTPSYSPTRHRHTSHTSPHFPKLEHRAPWWPCDELGPIPVTLAPACSHVLQLKGRLGCLTSDLSELGLGWEMMAWWRAADQVGGREAGVEERTRGRRGSKDLLRGGKGLPHK